jgi:hemin uptake protein HemP
MNQHTHPHSSAGLKSKPSSINAHELLGPRREIKLDFRGQEYCLRITRNEKLILTK